MKIKDFDFRIWDEGAKSYIKKHPAIALINGVKAGNIHFNDMGGKEFWGENYDKDIEIELYTGLKDKNGKKIYENDFIEFKTSLRNYKTYRGQVIFKEACFYALSDDNVYRLDGLFDMKVLGNIHEDKELLEQTKQNAPKKCDKSFKDKR
ncbi:YopX family protein [Campylobacter helveticus]|uniref:YopX family protein n=1 Tax=Campylobacter helveticus TaxID=28898 RepID=UPI0011122373|nr:YopX family protein [Campylobacter helveticus]TNB57359.1 hypothetical protein FDW44_07155 [Campylobacter helveticus]TNB61102.1 hypothetical protein FDW43_09210 [Campylobacter helveticus]